ncbi:SWIM zinc finger family protein [Halalkaliarchaeum sp. AArc-CO]|uniref:SWIM zinc finger family protein n=1 Tax=Halalkaliarchaeum sp. AArc-CO TaxID=2866381 RepID=UPI00217CDE86|nr:SWIM zinc finger family protein [Halalkaliarchaeum sp. AArc-CO]
MHDTSLPISQLDPAKRVLKRAQYEAFEFSLLNGNVLVRNASYSDPIEHEYLVTVHDGLPRSCECPSDTHSQGPCKHRVAVAIRTSILEAASAMQEASTTSE